MATPTLSPVAREGRRRCFGRVSTQSAFNYDNNHIHITIYIGYGIHLLYYKYL
jgi:hypothetical protein